MWGKPLACKWHLNGDAIQQLKNKYFTVTFLFSQTQNPRWEYKL